MKIIKLICVCLFISLLVGCQRTSSSYIKIRNDVYSIEVGIPISKEVKHYLDVESYTDEDYSKIAESAKMEINADDEDMIHKDNKSYEKVGVYQASVTYQGETSTFKIEVKDNRAPQIKGPNTVKIKLNEDYDYKKDFIGFDYGEMKSIEVDDSQIDESHQGTYFLNVKATDMAGNVNTKKVQVYVDSETIQKDEVHMNIPYYNQLDVDAPNGCEATSLYMALSYKKKVPIDLSQFIKDLPRTKTPYEGFFGDPFSTAKRSDDYYVIFPSPLMKYGSQYGTCRDISGSSLEDIRYELSLDNPVVVYGTGGLKTPQMKTYYFGEVIGNIHIVVLSGYNQDKGIFYVDDPITKDITEISYEDFEKVYNSMQYAITVE